MNDIRRNLVMRELLELVRVERKQIAERLAWLETHEAMLLKWLEEDGVEVDKP